MYYRLNYFRFYLALCVVGFHLYRELIPLAGKLAVLSFFFVSGFLISKLLNETYAHRPREFLVNRFLRIFPTYWASVFVGVLLLIFIPESLLEVNKVLKFPSRFDDWLSNIFIFGLQGLSVRIVPPAWSLDVELHWYIIFFVLSFFAVKFRIIFYSLICLAFIFFIYPQKLNYYGGVLGSGFAFSAGALFYHWKPKIPVSVTVVSSLLLVPYMFLLPHASIVSLDDSNSLFHWVIPSLFIVILFLSFSFFLKQHEHKKYQCAIFFILCWVAKLPNIFDALVR